MEAGGSPAQVGGGVWTACLCHPQHREQTEPEEEPAMPELQVVPGECLPRTQVSALCFEPLLPAERDPLLTWFGEGTAHGLLYEGF